MFDVLAVAFLFGNCPLSASSFTSTSQHSSARPRFHTRLLSSSGLAGTRSCPQSVRRSSSGGSTSRFALRCHFVLCVLVLVCLAGALESSSCCSRDQIACGRPRFRALSSLDGLGPRDVSERELRSFFGAVFAALRPLDLAGAPVSLVGPSQGEGGLLPRGASSLGSCVTEAVACIGRMRSRLAIFVSQMCALLCDSYSVCLFVCLSVLPLSLSVSTSLWMSIATLLSLGLDLDLVSLLSSS